MPLSFRPIFISDPEDFQRSVFPVGNGHGHYQPTNPWMRLALGGPDTIPPPLVIGVGR